MGEIVSFADSSAGRRALLGAELRRLVWLAIGRDYAVGPSQSGVLEPRGGVAPLDLVQGALAEVDEDWEGAPWQPSWWTSDGLRVWDYLPAGFVSILPPDATGTLFVLEDDESGTMAWLIVTEPGDMLPLRASAGRGAALDRNSSARVVTNWLAAEMQ